MLHLLKFGYSLLVIRIQFFCNKIGLGFFLTKNNTFMFRSFGVYYLFLYLLNKGDQEKPLSNFKLYN